MPIQREFLGWRQPALAAAGRWLVAHYGCELGGVVVAVPGSRGGRRLLEILVELAEARGEPLTPPKITTAGHLPELLYLPQFPFAGELVQRLAWARVLSRADRRVLSRVITQPPERDDLPRWLDLAEMLKALHRELATSALSFSDVASAGSEVEGFNEQRRWEALAELQEEYHRTLDRLKVWDLQTARRVAIEKREPQTDRDIVLVGAADLNQATRMMLDQVADRVTALVVAPPEMADRFDEHGCLIPAAWQQIELPIEDEQIVLAEGPGDVSDAAAARIAAYEGKYAADEITIGLADERLAPQIVRRLEESNVSARFGPGRPLSETAPLRLLSAVADFAERRRYPEFAALVRDPAVYKWIDRRKPGAGWLTKLDTFYNEHLPARLLRARTGRKLEVDRVVELVDSLVADLTERRRPLHEWMEPIRKLLAELYGEQEINKDDAAGRATLRGCETLYDVLLEHSQTPPELSPEISAADAIRLAVEQAGRDRVAEPSLEAAVELLGWLELPLDDAPALVVAGFNDELVPGAADADLFLPGALRTQLGLLDNDVRAARDAYALSVLAASRERLSLIVARRDADGNPLLPSRLLFHADRETIARRSLRLFRQTDEEARPAAPAEAAASAESSRFFIPAPVLPTPPIDSLRVTAFRDYFNCPYRFYLRHVLGLKVMDDAVEELDGGAFGTLLHKVLERFGRPESDVRHSCDAPAIEAALFRHLDDVVEERFGAESLAPVAIQIEQMRLRLSAFAREQAKWAADGWRIEYSEQEPDPSEEGRGRGDKAQGDKAQGDKAQGDKAQGDKAQRVEWSVDGRPFFLRGRIDRVDRHVETGEWFVLDYKSSDRGDGPQRMHRKSDGTWIDLQLPLYRHLARRLGATGTVRLGYFVMPRDTAGTRVDEAMWDSDDLESADEQARDVIRKVRAGEFTEVAEIPPPFSEDFAPICQDTVFDRPPRVGVVSGEVA